MLENTEWATKVPSKYKFREHFGQPKYPLNINLENTEWATKVPSKYKR